MSTDQAQFGSMRKRILRAEFAAQRSDRLDLLVGIEHAALQLDLTEAVLRPSSSAACRTIDCGIEALALLVLARIVA